MTVLTHWGLSDALHNSRLKKRADNLIQLSAAQGSVSRDRRLTDWLKTLENLPNVRPSSVALDQSVLKIGNASDMTSEHQTVLLESLKKLSPWRKGPFNFFGTQIDTEWRSDLKWDRLSPHISDLSSREVLDVGCGSGYHCWRMRAAGAALVIGVEPSLLFCSQFQAAQRYVQDINVQVLPLKLDELPANTSAFQTTFSMGVLYHRRSPFDHLANLRDSLQPGGELVLETLVVDGPLHHVLVPEDRYAQMRNVWCLPSTLTLEHWLKRMGFKFIRTVDITQTTDSEQRQTDWMSGHSLNHFLDPQDPSRTIEGYPAPKRAILIAQR